MMLIMLMYLSIQAQSKFVLKSQNSKISGTSTIHDWKINVTKFSGNSSIVFESNNLKDIKAFDIQIAGKDLKSEKGSKDMDEKMYEALKIPTNPTINFKLNKITALPTSANGHTLSATGAFTIGGFSKEESLSVQVKPIDSNSLEFSGSKKIKMSDYKLKPPTAMMGMMKTGDEVEIQFDFTMQRSN